MGIPTIFDFKWIRERLNQIDVNKKELNIHSENNVEAVLAKSSEEIDNRVKKKKFGGSGKGSSYEELEVASDKIPSSKGLNVQVDVDINQAIENAGQNKSKQVKTDRQLGDD